MIANGPGDRGEAESRRRARRRARPASPPGPAILAGQAQPCDQPTPRGPGLLPEGWMDFAPGLEVAASDLFVTKRQWGAVYGTDLDLQLRRRGVRTVVLCGVATNFGVESTARDLWERGYALVFAEDAMASRTAELHRFPVEHVFPRLGRVRATAEVVG